MVTTRGDIWWASLPDPRGFEPGYRRPVLIVQSDAFNRSMINTVIVAVITSNQENVTEQGGDYPALRSPTLGWKEPSMTIASSLEHRPNQTQHAAVSYAL
ncbi:MAG: type II toxin-antitoxin system PemK/MazF family toxin, partial [Deltaproteobacteria bacterium]|nr:type II toxin-antitoxin system PemK/MazF family toxin [Deltaproteobacteria bacterium]